VLLLTILIFPLYFAGRIAKSGEAHPYRMLLETTVLYALLARAMIIPTYWFAHIYQPMHQAISAVGASACLLLVGR
jgi:hypothetical protein